MATYYYATDANGKRVLTGTSTPVKENGVVVGHTYAPAATGTTSASSSTTNKGGTTVQAGSASPATGNSQYTGVTGGQSDYQNWLATDKNAATAKAAGANDSQLKRLYDAGLGWVAEYEKGNMAAADAYHAAAQAVRAELQYDGGEDGSQYIPFQQSSGGGFNYAPAPTHTDPYSSRIDAMLNEVLNRDKFSYDALSDPLYQQYSQQYQREGERAMQDTLGQVSARTGGLASSYATSAAAQANNYYASQLADKIPELYQLAYSMYLDDIDGKVRDLGLLENASDRQYNRYQDTLDAWRNDRDFAYDRYNDDIDRQIYADEWMYNVGRNNVLDAEKKDATDYERGREQETDAYNRAWDLIDSGVMPDDEQLKAAGISATQAAAIIATKKAAAAAKGSSGGGGDPAPKPAELDYEGLFAAARDSGHPQSFIANNYKKYGFTSATGLYSDFETWAESEPKPGVDVGTAMLSLGIGPVTASFVSELASYGAIVEDESGALHWANGWDASNYKEKLQARKNPYMNLATQVDSWLGINYPQ